MYPACPRIDRQTIHYQVYTTSVTVTMVHFADIPFARLDVVMLLIKNHLKGKIPDMLNQKDNQVFLDWLGGGHDKQLAREREANAQSNRVLSMAATYKRKDTRIHTHTCTYTCISCISPRMKTHKCML